MKVCVSSQGTSVVSPVDDRFGRAAFLLVVDTETGEVHPLEGNPGAAHGAGVEAAQAVVRAAVSAVVTGEVGPKAFQVLSAAHIPIYRAASVSVSQALQALREGRLEPVAAAGGPGHSGRGRAAW